MTTPEQCRDDRPRRRARRRDFNAIDYVEVTRSDDGGSATLDVFLINPAQIDAGNVRIEGGTRIPGSSLEVTRFDLDEGGQCFSAQVEPSGDFGVYTLRLVGADGQSPPDGFDPRGAAVEFSFMIDCPSDVDCAAETPCPPEIRVEPEINYLAKDFSSFRQLALDRMALLAPDWTERHIPDLGVTLVEVLAYVGDTLSYYQDAVATEAYLNTARQRISVRRHARLVDYRMHEGLNARAWLCLQVEAGMMTLPLRRVYFITDRGLKLSLPGAVAEHDTLVSSIERSLYEIFEPVIAGPDETPLYAAHNRLTFYTWGERECCLPRGATSATLRDAFVPAPPTPVARRTGEVRAAETAADDAPPRALHLKPGDVLIFQEVIGPRTGNPADADPTHRHAVRLTRVTPGYDPVFQQPVVEIAWADADALPFPLCISTVTDECGYLEDVTVACGNVILVDHGGTVGPECLGPVQSEPEPVPCETADCGEPPRRAVVRYNPRLRRRSLVFTDPVDPTAPASLAIDRREARDGMPAIQLVSIPGERCDPYGQDRETFPYSDTACLEAEDSAGLAWLPREDLLASSGEDRDFVVEVDDDGVAHLRFGDGELGEQPMPDTVFCATYRVGGGGAGNVGAETIRRMIVRGGVVQGVTEICNPMPASGGMVREPVTEVKLYAPMAYRRELMRAIVAEDYATLAEQHPGVQQAAAWIVWTGGRAEVIVAIDPLSGQPADAAFLESVRRHLLPYRRIGHGLRVVEADYVPLDVTVEVCCKSAYLRHDVQNALLARLGSGRGGFFHVDNLTFGSGLAFSRLVAAAQSVEGVDSVESVTVIADDVVYTWPFAVPFDPAATGERSESLPVVTFAPSQIPQLANDPNHVERGMLTLNVKGGR